MVPMLIAIDCALHLATGQILVCRYEETGDCDTILWPKGHIYAAMTPKDRRDLASALFDEYECGNLSERTVALPDGSAFNIDNNLA